MITEFVVSVGNAYVNGLKLYGPFFSRESAIAWAEDYKAKKPEDGRQWSVVPVRSADSEVSIFTEG